MAEDPKTRSLLLAVLDGHGEDGDKVAQFIKGKLANYLFKDRDFATDIKASFTRVIAAVESELLRGFILSYIVLTTCRYVNRNRFFWNYFHCSCHSW